MSMEIVTAPTLAALSTQEAKDFLRVSHSDDDDLIDAMVSAATEMAQARTGRQLLTCTRKLRLNEWKSSVELEGYEGIVLPYAPVQSVTHVKYVDTSGTQQTLTENTDYKVSVDDSSLPFIYLPHGNTWPSLYSEPLSIEIQYVCGWSAAASVPEALKQWLRIAVATMYEHREAFVSGSLSMVPDTFLQGLLTPFEITRVG